MRANCFEETVNLEIIHREIDKFQKYNDGKKPSYIVMNLCTRAKICYTDPWTLHTIDAPRGLTAERLFDIPIAFNNELENGEIDLV